MSQRKEVACDFMERMLLNPDEDVKIAPTDESRPYDVVEQIEAILLSNKSLSGVTNDYHNSILAQGKIPFECSWSTDEGLAEIELETREYFKEIAGSEEQAEEYLKLWDETVWPNLRPILAGSQEESAWARTIVTKSRYAATFLANIARSDLAKVMPAAFGVLWDITGQPGIIQPSDAAFVAFLEESLQWVRLRSGFFQDVLDETYDVLVEDEEHYILFPGGGCDGVLWTRGFYLEENEYAVIYDKCDCRAELEILLGKTLEEAHIEYHVGSFLEALDDPGQIGRYDEIILSGVMPYLWSDRIKVMEACKKLANDDGAIVFDLSIACLSYLFVKLACGWPSAEMFLPTSFDEAYKAAAELAKSSNLTLTDYYYEKPEKEDCCSAGAAFVLK